MPCYHPLRAWRAPNGKVSLRALDAQTRNHTPLRLPCGGCLGCRTAAAKAWALRCSLELETHPSATFTTLTYDEEHLPITLSKQHLSDFVRSLRKRIGPTRPIRFFASGEYGEKNHRPHYHAILYGANLADANTIEAAWGKGHTRTDHITPARIAYVAGYTSKKINWRLTPREIIDPETGEYLGEWQPPFIQMSRRPGIGSHARDAYTNSWRLYAINKLGLKQPVPRYLHEGWLKTATEQEKEELIAEKSKLALKRDTSEYAINAAEKHAIKQQELKASRRQL